MSLEGKSADEIRTLEQTLIDRLTEHDGYSGNISLRRELGWADDIYWSIRNRLVDQGRLYTKRARGGAIGLVEIEQIAAENLAQQEPNAPPAPQNEAELYPPVREVLNNDWSKDQRFRHHLVEVVAAQGRRNTGGTWTRPDIVVAAVRIFPFLPNKFFDVITFEIKPASNINLTAVYEALAHRRAATQSYVWFHCTDVQQAAEEDNLKRIAEECDRHGIGLIVASDPANYETWDTRVDAERVIAEPARLNDFIALQISEGGKDQISAWVR